MNWSKSRGNVNVVEKTEMISGNLQNYSCKEYRSWMPFINYSIENHA